jgi:hypothetical protein
MWWVGDFVFSDGMGSGSTHVPLFPHTGHNAMTVQGGNLTRAGLLE